MFVNSLRGRDLIRGEVFKLGDVRKAFTDSDVFVGIRRWTFM